MGTTRIPKIQDYGVVGDCRAAALISKYGSVEWLCWPRFDSPSIFAAILDRAKGGCWSISPRGEFDCRHSYIRDTNVLETAFVTSTGRMVLTDVMPVASEDFKRQNLLPDHELMREVICTDGEVEIAVEFYPRAKYGLHPVRIRQIGKCGMRMDVETGAYWLRSSQPMQLQADRAHLFTRLQKSQRLQFSLTYDEESPAVLPALGNKFHDAVKRSTDWWQGWAGRCRYEGPYREAVTRSALALKLLAYSPSGAITAAPTTSLPEHVGGSLNWDYRYCWLRDASLTIRAMIGLGYMAEAESFLSWLLHATRLTRPELRILYTVFGQLGPAEEEIPHLSGYFNSRPVRIGNGARGQSQLDIYGEVVDAAAQYALDSGGFNRTTQKVLIGLGKYVAQHWDQPDEGIWEPRSGRKNHTYSRLMCWTALDRLLALGEKGILHNFPREQFQRERDKIRRQIETRAWNSQHHTYVETLDGDKLDAVLLRIPWYGFEPADSARMKQTFAQIRKRLSAGDSLLYRYELQPREGAFGVCGFWAVEHLALGGGTLDQAHHLFQELLRYGNDLGLFSEEIDPTTGDALGNFPQGFTHIGLISAALTLQERERGESHPAAKTGEDVDSDQLSRSGRPA